MFNHCSNFTISGGEFSLVEGSSVGAQSDFRSVRVGDLNILSEVGKEDILEYREVRRRRTGALIQRVPAVVGTRRIHQVRVFGSQETMTAIIYEGPDFEEWKADVEGREAYRHSSVLQLFGVTRSATINALIFHDGLLSLDTLRHMHRRSPLASAYLEYTLSRDLNAAASHWNRMTGVWLYDFDSPGYAPWIRESTGHLCIDVGATSTSAPAHAAALDDPVADVVCLTSGSKNIEQALLSEMELDDIHTILCYGKIRESEISIWAGDVEFGSMWDTNPESDFAPCFAEEKRFFSGALTLADVQKDTPWMYEDTSTGRRYDCPPTDVVDGGWTRIDIQALDGGKFRGPARGVHHFVRAVQLGRAHDVQKWWLSQANHVLRDDKYPGFYEKCFLVTHLSFTISIWNPQDSHTLRGTFMVDAPITPVYLFLFPPQLRLKDGELSARIPYPGEAFYWSHDPRGRDRLSEAAVHALGLPSVFLQARVGGPAWTQANYALLAEFHCAKGFDPTSMDVARDLGYPRANTSEKRRLIFRGIGNSVLRRARETLATYPSCGYEDVCIRCKRIDSLLCLIQDQTVWRRPVQLSLTLPPRSQMQCARSITERMRQASALGGQETEAQMAWRTARPTMSNTYRSISETMRRASDLGS